MLFNKNIRFLKSKVYLYSEIVGIRFLTVLVQLLFVKYITNIMVVDELGVYYFLSTLAYVLNAIILVPLDYFQQANLYKYLEAGFSLKTYVLLNKRIVFYIFLVIIIGNVFLLLFSSQYCFRYTIVILMSLCTYFSLFLRGMVNNLEHRRQAVYNLFFESVLRIICLAILVYIFPVTPIIVLISLLLASIIVSFHLCFFISRLPQYKRDKIKQIDLKCVWTFSRPLSISSIINWIQLQGYRILLVPLGFSEIVGFYATVSNIGNSGMSICATIYNQLFLPDLYKNKGMYFYKYIKYAFLVVLTVLFVSAVLKKNLILLLTNKVYLDYSYLIVFGILTEAGNFLIGNITAYLGIKNSTYQTLVASVFGIVIFSILFMLMFITNNIGVSTIGLSIVLSQGIVVGYLLLMAAKLYKKEKINL